MSTSMDFTDAAYKVLSVVQSFAPNSDAQAVVSEQYNFMAAEGTPLELLKGVTAILSDGLRYGNWPWIVIPNGQ